MAQTPSPVAQSSAPAAVPSAASPAAAQVQPAVNMAAEQKAHPQSGIVNPKYTGEPISVNLKDVDMKDFFRLNHEKSGLKVVLDPNVNSSLTIVIVDVSQEQAFEIVLKRGNLA